MTKLIFNNTSIRFGLPNKEVCSEGRKHASHTWFNFKPTYLWKDFNVLAYFNFIVQDGISSFPSKSLIGMKYIKTFGGILVHQIELGYSCSIIAIDIYFKLCSYVFLSSLQWNYWQILCWIMNFCKAFTSNN